MSLSSTLRSWVPENAPQKWVPINVLCCIWSLVLLLIVIFATDDSISKKLAKAQYLVYDLTTTIVWVTEIGLTDVFGYDVTSWHQWLEFVLAIYFCYDSAKTLYKFKLRKEHTSEMGVAVLIGFLSYLYKSIVVTRDARRRQAFDELVGTTEEEDDEQLVQPTAATQQKHDLAHKQSLAAPICDRSLGSG